MGRIPLALSIVLLFVLHSFSASINTLVQHTEANSQTDTTLFNQSGFYEDGVYTTTDGEIHVNRPHISWTFPNQGLSAIRTGACSVAVDSLQEVWLIGGRTDPNPTQSNDESPTSLIEKMDNHNKTWLPSDVNMPSPQQYCEAEMVGDKIFVVGDWFRNSNPTEYPTGKVQIFNFANNTWYNGTPMPSSQERGLGGMAEAGGYLYYAGGVRNPSATDATNRTYRYDTVNDSWSRMADMHHARASFELINFHGHLYAIGGFQGTSSWNRQAMDYVERYDPSTDTWTNLTALPQAMFGWGGTVLNDEIVLVGGFNGGPKQTVYHWNPVEDTWSQGNNIGSIGHFDVTVEEINGSIIWASGDMSSYAYNTWNQVFSADTEYQNQTGSHSGWVTSPVIDLRPNVNGRAIPVQFNLQGNNTPGGELSFQYRTSYDSSLISNNDWIGIDGTVNTTFPLGETDVDLETYANFVQYRIRLLVSDLPNWDEPDLDAMSIRAEHAAFNSSLPTVLHPRAETFHIQTSHDAIENQNFYIEMASCDSLGIVNGPWSRISYDGTSFNEYDLQGLFIDSAGEINSTHSGETIIDWSVDLGDLTGISFLCVKAGSSGQEIVEYQDPNPIIIDNILEVSITDLGNSITGDTIPGGVPVNIGLKHIFPSSGMTISSGDVQARLTFDIRVNDVQSNNHTAWVNQTSPWVNLTTGASDIISWTPPTDVSGLMEIGLESRSDQSFVMQSVSNESYLLLDNENPIVIMTTPSNSSYLDSQENREISILVADTSGFNYEDVDFQVWIENLDDNTNGALSDGEPQDEEYRSINFSMENIGTHWWFNATQSDDVNQDQQLVYARLIGTDLVQNPIQNNTIWWRTRDAQNAVVEKVFNTGGSQYWEVSRSISWEFEVSDGNGVSDLIDLRLELGGDSDFGVKYDIADSLCYSLDQRVDSDRTVCSHSYIDENILVSLEIFAGWEVDRSVLEEGLVEIIIKDIDGVSKTTFQNMWVFSQDFDFEITSIVDNTGSVQGEITEQSIVVINDLLVVSGDITHSLSGTPYSGDLSVSWWGQLQGANWFGAGTVSVVDGVINTTIPMPSTGGLMDFSIAFMDPMETRTLGSIDVPIFIVDSGPPIILESNLDGFSRYHLDDVGMGIKIVEEVSWTGPLEITCQVISTEISWEPVTVMALPSNVFQGRTLFSVSFDLSNLGDPSLLSPEARIDCWATGEDDAGLALITSTENPITDPWLSLPLSNVGPNIQLVEVKLDSINEPGKEVRAEISVLNSGESLQDSFNITVYTIVGEQRELVGRFSQSQIASGQGIVKRFPVTIPEGDWTLEVIVDEDQRIWELNESDNTFTKQYFAAEEVNVTIYIVAGTFAIFALISGLVMLRKRKNESKEAKKLPSLDNLPRSGPPKLSANSTKPQANRPKRGPPPKKKVTEVASHSNITDITSAMAKLSLDDLPGRDKTIEERIPSYESLPPGGDYEYLAEGTFYLGDGIGRWKLNDDGSFTKVG